VLEVGAGLAFNFVVSNLDTSFRIIILEDIFDESNEVLGLGNLVPVSRR
jgi:hypothetical protein